MQKQAEHALNSAFDASEALDRAIEFASAAGVSKEVVAVLTSAVNMAKEELGTDEDSASREPRMWYVGDLYDNFGEYDNIADAASQAENMVSDGLPGVYIIHLTKPEFDAFCQTGKHLVGKK